MNPRLLKLLIITNFGRGAVKPLQTAIVRLVAALAFSLIMGLTIANVIRSAGLGAGSPAAMIFAIIVITSFIMVGLMLVSLDAARGQAASMGNIDRITALLPIPQKQRWLTRITPSGIIACLIVVLLSPAALVFSPKFNVDALIILSCLVLGALAAIGNALAFSSYAFAVRAGMWVAVAALCVGLINQAVFAGSAAAPNLHLGLVFGLLALMLGGFIQSYVQAKRVNISPRESRAPYSPAPFWLPVAWFGLKTIRHRRTYVSLVFSLTMISAAAVLLAYRQAITPQDTGILVLSAMLAGAFACDIRGISRKHRAPEIQSLGGVRSFVIHEAGTAVLAGMLIGFPLLMALLAVGTKFTLGLVLMFVCIHFASALIGLLASTIFVPQSGEIGSQFFSVMLTTSAILGYPKLAQFSNISTYVQSAAWLGVGIICILAVMLIELNRRNQYGSIPSST